MSASTPTTTTAATSSKSQAPQELRPGAVPYLTVEGATRASEFYQRAFGAEEVFRNPVDEQGRTMHIHLFINGGSLMLCDAYPEHGHPYRPAQGFNLHLQVDDVEPCWRRAVAAGCEVVSPLTDMFWGDRYGQLRDPFGVLWAMGSHIKHS